MQKLELESTSFMKSKKPSKKQLAPTFSGTVAGVTYCIGVTNPITGEPGPNLESSHLKALMLLLSWGRSPEKYDDWFVVSDEELLTINLGEEDGMQLLFTLLPAWVRTCVPDEAPLFTQFATITAINEPWHHYSIRFSNEMVPVVKAFHAYIYRNRNRDPLTPVLKFT